MTPTTENWILLPPGNKAILRKPADTIPESCQQAMASDLIVANLGYPFPWGRLPSAEKASRLWKESRIGMGGLVHDRWFVTQEGRFGGATNVIQTLPGSLRYCLLLDGGLSCDGSIEDNEGFAVIRKTTEDDALMYRRVQLHAAERVGADGGAILVSPICEDGIVRVGFTGRCLTCQNPELVSVRQLQKEVPQYQFELWPEWRNWHV